jgi:hypothetical protein
LIECAPSWKNIEHDKFFAVKNTVIIGFFAPAAYRVLGMTSTAEWANIAEVAVVC